MRVVHVVKTLSIEYGGPARSVQGLVSALERNGIEAWLVTLEDGGAPYVDGINHFRVLGGGVFDVKRRMVDLIDEIKPDIIHTHDCWMPKLHMCHVAARERGVPYVISPRGSLKRWSRNHKRLKKWVALQTYEGYDLKHAAALHVTAADEHTQVAELGFNPNIIEVPNGVNLPSKIVEPSDCTRVKRRALFLSRIHYTKGLMNLVEAWSKVRPADWELEIVGTDADGYQCEVEARVAELGLQRDIIFSGPVIDVDKWAKYAAADLFVHPSFTENFGIVIAEALYAGVPVITTKGAPWQDLVSHKCGWWVDVGVEPLAEALKSAIALSDQERRAMGMRGHDLVEKKYTWDEVVKKMIESYGITIAIHNSK